MGICVIIYISVYIYMCVYVCMYQSDKSRLSTWNHPVDFDPNLTVQWQSETVVLHDGPCHCLDLSVVTAETSCGMTMNLAGYKVTIKSQQGKTWIVLDATINIKSHNCHIHLLIQWYELPLKAFKGSLSSLWSQRIIRLSWFCGKIQIILNVISIFCGVPFSIMAT